jgi:hypothetical protein
MLSLRKKMKEVAYESRKTSRENFTVSKKQLILSITESGLKSRRNQVKLIINI